VQSGGLDKKMLSFGTRRMHPVVAPAIEYSAYIGGMDGVSNTAVLVVGYSSCSTMPHALVLALGGDPGRPLNTTTSTWIHQFSNHASRHYWGALQ